MADQDTRAQRERPVALSLASSDPKDVDPILRQVIDVPEIKSGDADASTWDLLMNGRIVGEKENDTWFREWAEMVQSDDLSSYPGMLLDMYARRTEVGLGTTVQSELTEIARADTSFAVSEADLELRRRLDTIIDATLDSPLENDQQQLEEQEQQLADMQTLQAAEGAYPLIGYGPVDEKIANFFERMNAVPLLTADAPAGVETAPNLFEVKVQMADVASQLNTTLTALRMPVVVTSDTHPVDAYNRIKDRIEPLARELGSLLDKVEPSGANETSAYKMMQIYMDQINSITTTEDVSAVLSRLRIVKNVDTDVRPVFAFDDWSVDALVNLFISINDVSAEAYNLTYADYAEALSYASLTIANPIGMPFGKRVVGKQMVHVERGSAYEPLVIRMPISEDTLEFFNYILDPSGEAYDRIVSGKTIDRSPIARFRLLMLNRGFLVAESGLTYNIVPHPSIMDLAVASANIRFAVEDGAEIESIQETAATLYQTIKNKAADSKSALTMLETFDQVSDRMDAGTLSQTSHQLTGLKGFADADAHYQEKTQADQQLWSTSISVALETVDSPLTPLLEAVFNPEQMRSTDYMTRQRNNPPYAIAMYLLSRARTARSSALPSYELARLLQSYSTDDLRTGYDVVRTIKRMAAWMDTLGEDTAFDAMWAAFGDTEFSSTARRAQTASTLIMSDLVWLSEAPLSVIARILYAVQGHNSPVLMRPDIWKAWMSAVENGRANSFDVGSFDAFISGMTDTKKEIEFDYDVPGESRTWVEYQTLRLLAHSAEVFGARVHVPKYSASIASQFVRQTFSSRKKFMAFNDNVAPFYLVSTTRDESAVSYKKAQDITHELSDAKDDTLAALMRRAHSKMEEIVGNTKLIRHMEPFMQDVSNMLQERIKTIGHAMMNSSSAKRIANHALQYINTRFKQQVFVYNSNLCIESSINTIEDEEMAQLVRSYKLKTLEQFTQRLSDVTSHAARGSKLTTAWLRQRYRARAVDTSFTVSQYPSSTRSTQQLKTSGASIGDVEVSQPTTLEVGVDIVPVEDIRKTRTFNTVEFWSNAYLSNNFLVKQFADGVVDQDNQRTAPISDAAVHDHMLRAYDLMYASDENSKPSVEDATALLYGASDASPDTLMSKIVSADATLRRAVGTFDQNPSDANLETIKSHVRDTSFGVLRVLHTTDLSGTEAANSDMPTFAYHSTPQAWVDELKTSERVADLSSVDITPQNDVNSLENTDALLGSQFSFGQAHWTVHGVPCTLQSQSGQYSIPAFPHLAEYGKYYLGAATNMLQAMYPTFHGIPLSHEMRTKQLGDHETTLYVNFQRMMTFDTQGRFGIEQQNVYNNLCAVPTLASAEGVDDLTPEKYMDHVYMQYRHSFELLADVSKQKQNKRIFDSLFAMLSSDRIVRSKKLALLLYAFAAQYKHQLRAISDDLVSAKISEIQDVSTKRRYTRQPVKARILVLIHEFAEHLKPSSAEGSIAQNMPTDLVEILDTIKDYIKETNTNKKKEMITFLFGADENGNATGGLATSYSRMLDLCITVPRQMHEENKTAVKAMIYPIMLAAAHSGAVSHISFMDEQSTVFSRDIMAYETQFDDLFIAFRDLDPQSISDLVQLFSQDERNSFSDRVVFSPERMGTGRRLFQAGDPDAPFRTSGYFAALVTDVEEEVSRSGDTALQLKQIVGEESFQLIQRTVPVYQLYEMIRAESFIRQLRGSFDSGLGANAAQKKLMENVLQQMDTFANRSLAVGAQYEDNMQWTKAQIAQAWLELYSLSKETIKSIAIRATAQTEVWQRIVEDLANPDSSRSTEDTKKFVDTVAVPAIMSLRQTIMHVDRMYRQASVFCQKVGMYGATYFRQYQQKQEEDADGINDAAFVQELTGTLSLIAEAMYTFVHQFLAGVNDISLFTPVGQEGYIGTEEEDVFDAIAKYTDLNAKVLSMTGESIKTLFGVISNISSNQQVVQDKREAYDAQMQEIDQVKNQTDGLISQLVNRWWPVASTVDPDSAPGLLMKIDAYRQSMGDRDLIDIQEVDISIPGSTAANAFLAFPAYTKYISASVYNTITMALRHLYHSPLFMAQVSQDARNMTNEFSMDVVHNVPYIPLKMEFINALASSSQVLPEEQPIVDAAKKIAFQYTTTISNPLRECMLEELERVLPEDAAETTDVQWGVYTSLIRKCAADLLRKTQESEQKAKEVIEETITAYMEQLIELSKGEGAVVVHTLLQLQGNGANTTELENYSGDVRIMLQRMAAAYLVHEEPGVDDIGSNTGAQVVDALVQSKDELLGMLRAIADESRGQANVYIPYVQYVLRMDATTRLSQVSAFLDSIRLRDHMAPTRQAEEAAAIDGARHIASPPITKNERPSSGLDWAKFAAVSALLVGGRLVLTNYQEYQKDRASGGFHTKNAAPNRNQENAIQRTGDNAGTESLEEVAPNMNTTVNTSDAHTSVLMSTVPKIARYEGMVNLYVQRKRVLDLLNWWALPRVVPMFRDSGFFTAYHSTYRGPIVGAADILDATQRGIMHYAEHRHTALVYTNLLSMTAGTITSGAVYYTAKASAITFSAYITQLPLMAGAGSALTAMSVVPVLGIPALVAYGFTTPTVQYAARAYVMRLTKNFYDARAPYDNESIFAIAHGSDYFKKDKNIVRAIAKSSSMVEQIESVIKDPDEKDVVAKFLAMSVEDRKKVLDSLADPDNSDIIPKALVENLDGAMNLLNEKLESLVEGYKKYLDQGAPSDNKLYYEVYQNMEDDNRIYADMTNTVLKWLFTSGPLQPRDGKAIPMLTPSAFTSQFA